MNNLDLLAQLKGQRHKNLGKVFTPERREQRARSMKGKNLGAQNGMKGKHLERITTLKGGAFTIHSPVEKDFALALDGDSSVLEFHYEAIKIRYLWRGHYHGFLVDFLIKRDTGWELVEIKTPHEFSQQGCAALISAAHFASKFGWSFSIWDGRLYRTTAWGAFEEESSSKNGANSGNAKICEDHANPELSSAKADKCVETIDPTSERMMR